MATKHDVAGAWWRIPVLVVCLVLAATLTWYNLHGSSKHPGLLTAVLLALLYSLVATGAIQPPRGVIIPFFNVWPRFSDASKAITSFLLIFLWTPVAKQLVPDSVPGAVIILAPDAVFLLAAFVYLSNGIGRNLP